MTGPGLRPFAVPFVWWSVTTSDQARRRIYLTGRADCLTPVRLLLAGGGRS